MNVTPERRPAIAGVVLTGGRSRRMRGMVKALVPLAGKPLIRHVIERVEPQVDTLMLGVETPAPEFTLFRLPQVADPQPGSRGPLGGLLSALRHVRQSHEWLLLAPCDAPFLPLDLADQLLKAARAGNAPGALVRLGSELQPTFSLWNRSLLPDVEKAFLGEGKAGFKQFLRGQSLAELQWPETDSQSFFNINDRVALDVARRLLESINGDAESCSA